jgi:hypothetical protein
MRRTPAAQRRSNDIDALHTHLLTTVLSRHRIRGGGGGGGSTSRHCSAAALVVIAVPPCSILRPPADPPCSFSFLVR